MSGVLALDLGQTIGYFLGNAVGPARWGEFECAQTQDLGKWLRSTDSFFQEILPHADAIAVEQPFLGDSYWPARKLLAQLGHLYWHCGFVGLSSGSIREIPVTTGKLTLTGHGNADKDLMIACAERDGYEGIGEHAADAYGLWKVFVFGAASPLRRKPRSSKGVSVMR